MPDKKYANDTARAQIQSFLEETIDNMDLDIDPHVHEAHPDRHHDFENPELVVNFTGPDVGMLLEHKAELLLALEHLTMEMLRMPPEDHSLICFDANDWRRHHYRLRKYLSWYGLTGACNCRNSREQSAQYRQYHLWQKSRFGKFNNFRK